MTGAWRALAFLLGAILLAGLSHLAWQAAGHWMVLVLLTIALIALFRHLKPPKFRG